MINGLYDLSLEKVGSLLIVAIGNVLRSDDGAGPKIVSRLTPGPNVQVINAETNIERYIEPIQRSKADLLLFIDCLSFGKPPGYAAVLPIGEICDFSFHSHNISLNRLTDFFTPPAYILGIEPASLKVGESLSPAIIKTVDEVVFVLNRYLITI